MAMFKDFGREKPGKRFCSAWRQLSRLHRCRGFTLVELVIGFVILGIVAAVAVPMVQESREAAKITQAIGDIQGIQQEIDMFAMAAKRLPDSLAEIGREDLTDPWDQPYVYTNFRLNPAEMRKDKNLKPINSTYDLYSVGEDGETQLPLTARASQDDIVRANDGGFVGLAEDY